MWTPGVLKRVRRGWLASGSKATSDHGDPGGARRLQREKGAVGTPDGGGSDSSEGAARVGQGRRRKAPREPGQREG